MSRRQRRRIAHAQRMRFRRVVRSANRLSRWVRVGAASFVPPCCCCVPCDTRGRVEKSGV